jgi:hypothetical protein
MSGLREKVIQAWGAAIAAEATRVEAVHAAVASAQEAATARERVMALIKEAVAWAALAERKAQERVLKVEARASPHWPLFTGRPTSPLERLPFLRVSSCMRARPKTRLRQTSRACVTRWSMSTGGERKLRGNAETWTRSSSFCKLGGPSCAWP